jgi:tetratricopeptide (TPR) repeat protein
MKRLAFAAIFSLASSGAVADTAEQALEACTKAAAAGNFSEAVQHAAASIAASSTNRNAYLCQARAYTGLNDRAHAIEALLAADRLSKSPLEHMVALMLIGNQNMALRELDKAMDQYHQSLSIAREIGDKHFEMINLNLIGEAQEAQSDYKSALENYLLAQKLAANDNERADSNARLAAAYSATGKHDKAVEHQLKAMLLEERSGDFDHYANAGLELGRIHIQAGQFDQAEKVLNKMLDKVRSAGDPYWEAKGMYYLASARRGQGDAQGAKPLLESARKLAEKIGAGDLLELISAQ